MTAEFHPASSGSGDPVGLAQEILDRIAADAAHANLTTEAHNLDALLALKQDAAGAVVSVNGQAGVVTLAATDVAAQPTDSDLTAIAALTTTTFGRALLTLADAAAGRAALGLGTAATQATSAFDAAGAAVAAQAAAIAASQPVDSDLTAIAALATTTFGRSLLAIADAAALKSSLSLVRADVGLANVDNTADVNKPVSTAQQTALDLKAPLASPALTGNPTSPTSATGDNDTSIATTAFVQQELAVIVANTRTASYTLALGDGGKAIEMNLGTATVLTIPPNSSVAFPIGTVIEVVRIGAGSVTLTPGAGVTIPNRLEAAGTTSRTLVSQYSTASLRKRATDTWVLVGDIA